MKEKEDDSESIAKKAHAAATKQNYYSVSDAPILFIRSNCLRVRTPSLPLSWVYRRTKHHESVMILFLIPKHYFFSSDFKGENVNKRQKKSNEFSFLEGHI